MSAVEPAALDYAARLERAGEEGNWDVRELVCLLREAVSRDDEEAAGTALDGLWSAVEERDDEADEHLASRKQRTRDLAAADGAAVVQSAVEVFGLQTVEVISAACFVLCELAEEPEGASAAQAACAAAARIALRTPPATDVEVADALLRGICNLFEGAFLNDGNAELCAEALAAGVVERLLAGCALTHGREYDHENRQGCLYALEIMCGASRTPPDAALRIAEAGGLDVIFAAMADSQPDTVLTLADYAVDLLKIMVMPTLAPLEEPHVRLLPLLRGRDAETSKHLLTWLAGHALDALNSAIRAVSALGMLACTASKWACTLELATVATDAIVAALQALQPKPDSLQFVAECADMLENFAGLCGEADAAKPGTYALRAGALPLLEATLATLDATDDDVDANIYDGIEFMVLKLQGVRADAVMAELLAEEEAEAAARKPKAGKGAKSKAKGNASKGKSAGAATASKSPPAKSTVIPAPAEATPEPAPPAPVPAPPQPEAPQSSLPPPLPPWLMQAMQPPAPAPTAAPAVQPAAPRTARPPNIAAALAATRISPPAAVPAPPQRWDAVATLPPAPPAGAWGRARPAIPGLSAGEVPRELECAICLDARAEGRTPCCGQTAFCAACAATLTGECPLCRASR